VAGQAEHGNVIPVVADGKDVAGGEAAQLGEMLKCRGFGAARGQDIDDREIFFGVDGAVQRDLGIRGLQLANRGDEGMLAQAGFDLAGGRLRGGRLA
jgi:hypothetical protein